jgi:inner membrane protein YidH
MMEDRSTASESRGKFGDASTELSARRTGMSFQRTRMSADRTLMSVIRTSLSLIGFGFTIYQFFGKLKETSVIAGSGHAPRTFGASLVWLGIGMLIFGILFHLQFMRGLRAERDAMKAEGLIYGESKFPVSLTLIVALALLAVGIAAIVSITFQIGPFG